MTTRVPTGKSVFYAYLKKRVKKKLQIVAIKQDVSASDYAGFIIEEALKNPPKYRQDSGEDAPEVETDSDDE